MPAPFVKALHRISNQHLSIASVRGRVAGPYRQSLFEVLLRLFEIPMTANRDLGAREVSLCETWVKRQRFINRGGRLVPDFGRRDELVELSCQAPKGDSQSGPGRRVSWILVDRLLKHVDCLTDLPFTCRVVQYRHAPQSGVVDPWIYRVDRLELLALLRRELGSD